MPNVQRELRISYGSLVVGGESDYLLDGYHDVRHDWETTEVGFAFIVTADSEEEFRSHVDFVETELRKPYQDLLIEIGQSRLLYLRQSDNTGLDAQPEVTKTDDPANTGRSRHYRVRIRLGRPADNIETPGLRRSSVQVAYTPARRRTVSISGEFTAIDTSTSREQYEAQIDAFTTAVITALGGTFELIGEPVARHGTNDKSMEFVRVFEERVFGQGAAALDDAALVATSLIVSKSLESPGDTPPAQRLTTVTARFSAWVDKDVSTDLVGKYASAKPWIVQQMQTTAGTGNIALVAEEPRFDYEENRFDVTIVGLSQNGTSQLIEHRVTVVDSIPSGKVFVPAWTGNPLSAYVYDGPQVRTRAIQQTSVYLGRMVPDQAAAAARALAQVEVGPPSPGGVWIRVSEDPSTTYRQLGLGAGSGDSPIDVTDVSAVTVFRLVAPVGPTTVGGGGAGGDTTGGFGAP